MKNSNNNIKGVIAAPPIRDILLLKKKSSCSEDKEHDIQDKDLTQSDLIDDGADIEKKLQDIDEDEEEFEEEKENFFENENIN